jgi:hypothetical protein
LFLQKLRKYPYYIDHLGEFNDSKRKAYRAVAYSGVDESERVMTKEDIDILKQVLCPHDEDYDEPCISPHNLEIVLEQLLLESVSK